jgi:hypothetical protein
MCSNAASIGHGTLTAASINSNTEASASINSSTAPSINSSTTSKAQNYPQLGQTNPKCPTFVPSVGGGGSDDVMRLRNYTRPGISFGYIYIYIYTYIYIHIHILTLSTVTLYSEYSDF